MLLMLSFNFLSPSFLNFTRIETPSVMFALFQEFLNLPSYIRLPLIRSIRLCDNFHCLCFKCWFQKNICWPHCNTSHNSVMLYRLSRGKSYIRSVCWGVSVGEDHCPGQSAFWGRVASSFLRRLYLPSVFTGSPFAAGWTVSELATIGSTIVAKTPRTLCTILFWTKLSSPSSP